MNKKNVEPCIKIANEIVSSFEHFDTIISHYYYVRLVRPSHYEWVWECNDIGTILKIKLPDNGTEHDIYSSYKYLPILDV